MGSPAAATPGASAWTIDTFAGSGEVGHEGVTRSGDGGPATAAQIAGPGSVTSDRSGNVYFAEVFADAIRRIDAAGTITTVAGRGEPADGLGDNGPATAARLNTPVHVVVAAGGDLYIADREHHRVRRIDSGEDGVVDGDADEIITTVVGTGTGGIDGDGGQATDAEIFSPRAVILDAAGNLYIGEGGRIRRVDAHTRTITTVAGNVIGGYGGDGGPAILASLDPQDLVLDAGGNLYVADGDNHRVRRIDGGADRVVTGELDETITTVAGSGAPLVGGYGGDGGPATSARLNGPVGIEVDGGGNLFIGDWENRRVRRVDASGIITTVAGTGFVGYSGDGGTAKWATLRSPGKLHLDAAGSLFVADQWNHRIRRVQTAPLVVETPDAVDEDEAFSFKVSIGGLAEDATGVTLTDTLPAEVSFVSANPSQGQCRQAEGTVSCDLGGIPEGATATVTIAVTATSPGVITNTATVDYQAATMAHNRTVATPARVSASDCAQEITTNTTLEEDIGPCAGDGLVVRADNIIVDLGGHRIFGFPGPSDGHSAGVRLGPSGPGLPGRSGVTMRNGKVSDFDAGIVITRGGGNTVTEMAISGNIGPDDPLSADLELSDGIVLFESADNDITNNLVVNNGIFDGIGVLGGGSDGNLIQGNTVQGTVGSSDGGPAGQGIIVNAAALGDNRGQTIENTVISNNMLLQNASAGISNVNNVGGTISNNTVEANGRTNSVGNGIGIQLGPGALITATNLVVEGNEVRGNGVDGIRVRTEGNTIRNNIVSANNANPAVNWYEGMQPGFDLRDRSSTCSTNTWRDNTWGTAGYSPECTTAGTPDTTVTSGPSGPTNDKTPTFAFSADRPSSTFACRTDGAEWTSCASPLTTAEMPEGPHTFEVRATETYSGKVDDTPAVRSFVVDAAPPDTTVTAGPSGPTADTTPSFEFSSNEDGSAFSCRIDGAAFSPCISGYTAAPLVPGPHTFEVAATDPAGNTDETPAERSFIVELPALSIADDSTVEGNRGTTTLLFSVSLSVPPAEEVSVAFATADDTAVAPEDYRATSGVLRFAPGETTKTVAVLVVGDKRREPHETFFVNLSNPSEATVSDRQALGTITNDDGRK